MDTPVHALLGSVLRGAREDKGLSLRAIAEKAGISATYLGEIERGVKEPSSAVLASIATALTISLSELYYDLALELRKRELLEAKRAAFAQNPPPAPVAPRPSPNFGFRAVPQQPVQPRNELFQTDPTLYSPVGSTFNPLVPVGIGYGYAHSDDEDLTEQAIADLPPLPQEIADLPPAVTNEAAVRALLSAFGDFLLARLADTQGS